MQYEPPTDEQLARFAAFQVGRFVPGASKELVGELLRTSPPLKAEWLKAHRRFQERIDALRPKRKH